MILLNNTKLCLGTFPNKETYLDVQSSIIRQDENSIRMKFESDSDLFQLYGLKKYIDEIAPESRVTLVMDYIPYSRMDRQQEDRLFTLKYLAEYINSLNFDSVVVMEPHSDVSIELINNLKVINKKVIPTGTVEIRYQDESGNTIRDTDVYQDVTGTQTYYAPNIEGYKLLEGIPSSVELTVLVDGSVLGHTFVYTVENSEPTPTEGSEVKATVEITYVGEEPTGDNLLTWLGSDYYYYEVAGDQTFYAPEIDGYIKPEQDSVTFTIEEGTNEYYHTFVYTKVYRK